ncbi:MAG: sigma factor-like helix-turn-helix DNA-binding protein [Methanocorpusculum sp.]|nr:sigma factor-like helix-turn-helix DNA-binding protein [Methanocorpusculum sp.]
MTAKQYLKQAYRLNERIKDKQERIDSLRLMSTSTGAIDYSKDRVQTSPSGDAPFTKQVMQIIQFEEELEADKNRMKTVFLEISRAIDQMENANHILVLSKRYLLMKTWEQIANEMNYSVMQIHRIHKDALENFVVPENMK